MKRNLILVGGGGHCNSVIEVAESVEYNIVGILDTQNKVGTKVLDYEVIGVDDEIPKYVSDCEFIISVGQLKSTALRRRLYKLITSYSGKLATIIANTAYVSRYAVIEEGSIVMHNAFVNANSRVGKCSIINTGSIIEHDVVIGDFSHVSTNATVNGGCIVGNEVLIGSGTTIKNGVKIVDRCIVGAGSTVVSSLNSPTIYIGSPASPLI